ncbi:MAG: bifunctional DNA-formamidopyrimidine glycosylase/DNA-(apurinic or apyrimidinic site) lyase [Myxococcota bacterium]
MPELPEVEFARRSLVKWFDGHRLVRAEADPKARTFRGARVADFLKLSGELVSATRRGKYLMLAFSDGRGVVAHLGMTGKFVKRKAGEDVPHSRARFVLDSGDVIHFRDPRLFGRIEPAPASLLSQVEAVAKLGVDPLVDGLSAAQLEAAIGRSKQALKVALMDQSKLAGLGNIHAAEALFRAHLHPSRTPASLSKQEWVALAKAIRDGISFALDVEGDDDEIEYVEEPGAPNPFLVYGRAGEPCRRCKTTVKSFTQGGRTTHFCPVCQPKNPKAKERSKR